MNFGWISLEGKDLQKKTKLQTKLRARPFAPDTRAWSRAQLNGKKGERLVKFFKSALPAYRKPLLHMRIHKPPQPICLKVSGGYYLGCHLSAFPLTQFPAMVPCPFLAPGITDPLREMGIEGEKDLRDLFLHL